MIQVAKVLVGGEEIHADRRFCRTLPPAEYTARSDLARRGDAQAPWGGPAPELAAERRRQQCSISGAQ